MNINELSTTDSDLQNKILLEPYEYIRTIPGKKIRSKLIQAFNLWFDVSKDKLVVIEDIVEMLHNSSLLIDDIQDNSILRRGVPVAHNIYGIPLTINSANFVYFLAMQKALTLKNPDVTHIFLEQMLELHTGQGLEIWWRDNFICPSEDEYSNMVIRKCGGLFNLAVRLMQVFACTEVKNLLKYGKLCQSLSLLFQIRDDYCNLMSKEYTINKSYCEDLTEGKFSFPVIHAINTRDTDTRIIDILKQRTEDIELKRYCMQLLHEFGSIEYTRRKCEELAKQIINGINALGGNIYLENIIQELMQVFNDNYGKNKPNDSGQNIGNDVIATDQIDEDYQQQWHEGINRNDEKMIATTSERDHS